MMEASGNSYMVIDRDYRFVWANAAYQRATMSSIQDISGRALFEAFPPPNAKAEQQLRTSIDRAFASGVADELAFIEYPIAQPDGTMALSYWSATHTPFRNDDGATAYVMQHTVNITELETLRRSHDAASVIEGVRSIEARYQGISREVGQLRNLVQQTPGFVAILSEPEHRFLMANDAYRRIVGGRDVVGKTVAEALPEVIEQGFIELLDQVLASGEPYFGRRQPITLTDEAGAPQQRYLEFVYQPILGDGGRAQGIFVQGHDVTEEVAAEERQRLLINELNHRVKNTLAIVQGLAQQSFGKLGDGRFQVFTSRLAALSGAHNLLTAATWESADLRELVYSSLDATAGLQVARCRLAGPPVTLPPPLVLSLAMIVHELSTNAIKYGALSVPTGHVEITWSVRQADEGVVLMLEWSEMGGPPVATPEREGFGTRLIRRGLSGQGEAELSYRPEGVHCRIEARL